MNSFVKKRVKPGAKSARRQSETQKCFLSSFLLKNRAVYGKIKAMIRDLIRIFKEATSIMDNNSAKKRLVTRSDFDGLACAMMLRELDIIDEIKFVHPKDVQDGKIELSENDITTNLP